MHLTWECPVNTQARADTLAWMHMHTHTRLRLASSDSQRAKRHTLRMFRRKRTTKYGHAHCVTLFNALHASSCGGACRSVNR